MTHLQSAAIPLVVATFCFAVIAACSGTSGISIPELGAASSSGTSGAGDSGTGGDGGRGTSGSSSGDACAPCQPAVPAGCTGTGACGCAPFVCPDAGGDAGPLGVGDDCSWGATDPCGPGLYCASESCGVGKCAERGTSDGDGKAPVCGCDAITYWNSAVAAKHGMSVKSDGACGLDGRACGGKAGTACPEGASCNLRRRNAEACKQAEATGTCWTLPETCPASLPVPGTQVRRCAANTCTDECTVIKEQITFTGGGLVCGLGPTE